MKTRSYKRNISIILISLIISLIITTPVALANTNNTIQYDANGNRISGFTLYFEYNNFNQLARVRESNANGPIIEEYSYWPDGTRSRKWEPQKNQTTYYFDKSFVRVVNASGTFDTTYYYDERDLVARKELWTGKMFYYYPDHLGSTSLITNETGSIVEETTYEPFGKVASGGSDRFLYTGKELDPGTGLEYYGARYYDPAKASQFISPDSNLPNVYDPQQLNRYAYARENPYTYTDPDGNAINLIAAAGGAIIGAAIGGIGSAVYQYATTGQVSWSDAGKAAGVGAVAGGVGGLTMGASLVTTVVGGAATGQAARGAENLLEGRAATEGLGNLVDIGIDAATAGVASKILPGVLSSSGQKTSQILPYKEAQKLTRGKGGEIQAHHILEQRFLKDWGFDVADAPSTVLTKEQHQKITNTLLERLPKGQTYSKSQVWSVYRDVYKDYPDHLKAIEGYFK